MTSLVRFETPLSGDSHRWLAGLLVSSQAAEVSAAVIRVVGRGLDARAELLGDLSAEIPRDTAARLRPALENGACTPAVLANVRAQLAEVEAALLDDLLAKTGLTPDRVLAAGVHDPGLWTCTPGEPRGYLGWCDAARLAELTSLNLVDAFPARDLAQGGLGGPLRALPEWLLLRDRRRNRVLLDLGRTTRMSYLPAQAADRAAAGIRCFEVGPGTALLDLLAQRLSGGEHRFDPGGRMAAQGRRLGPLVDRWLLDPFFHSPLPRWHPRGVRPERYLTEALQMAVASGWSVRDLLCTATHFLAETVSLALRKNLPSETAVDEIIVTGGGQHNGMLLHELGRLTAVPLLPIAQTAVTSEALGPASVALLAMLYLDSIPGNLPAITGAETPRILGRLTPGSPQNWQRFLQSYAGAAPAVRPLRSAI
jgi:anhydro-N-acetylmuramic acid kinase